MLCQFCHQSKGNRYRCPRCGTIVPSDAEPIGSGVKSITPDRQVIPGSEGASLRAGERVVMPQRTDRIAFARRQYEGRTCDDV